MPPDHAERMARVGLALEGLSVGDAFGGRFNFRAAAGRDLPPAPWHFSDDSVMALAIASALDRLGRIDPDELALDFARRYRADPFRGYGQSVRGVLDAIADGTPWPEASTST